jgi:CheY-like chemotaxis protein
MTPLTVLLAEDEDHIRTLVRGWLEQTGYRVTCVPTGREAIAVARKTAFDLAITDIIMPDGDGTGFIAELKKLRPATRVLAISGGGRIIDGNDCLRIAQGLGAHVALMKPFTREQLLTAVGQTLAPHAPSNVTAV